VENIVVSEERLFAIEIFNALKNSAFPPFSVSLMADSEPFDGKGDVIIDGHFDLERMAEILAPLLSHKPIGSSA
jgi:hypothetical protein